MVTGQDGQVRVLAGGCPERLEMRRCDHREVLGVQDGAGQLHDAHRGSVAPRGRILLYVAEANERGQGPVSVGLVQAELVGDLRHAQGAMRGHE
jgi:hypothetical protein